MKRMNMRIGSLVEDYPEFTVVEDGTRIRLHYIGKRFYTMGSFIKEAKRYGVSRALPTSVIKKLKWNDKIYVAFYEKDKRGPYALVFGLFYVQGLNVGNKLVKDAIGNDKRLRVVKSVDFSGSGGKTVVRGCGEYSISSVTYVDNELSELVEIIEDNAKKLNVLAKLMVTGPFVQIPPIKLRGAKFTRSVVYAHVPEELLSYISEEGHRKANTKKTVAYLDNYNLGRPSEKRKARVREHLSTVPLDKWVGGEKE